MIHPPARTASPRMQLPARSNKTGPGPLAKTEAVSIARRMRTPTACRNGGFDATVPATIPPAKPEITALIVPSVACSGLEYSHLTNQHVECQIRTGGDAPQKSDQPFRHESNLHRIRSTSTPSRSGDCPPLANWMQRHVATSRLPPLSHWCEKWPAIRPSPFSKRIRH
jgi:hypothetical protein